MSLQNVELISADISNAIECKEQLSFKITLRTNAVIEGAYISLNIFNSLGICVYWSADIESERFKNPTRGIETIFCTCPRYLLTPGIYSIFFSIYCIGRGIIHHEEDKYLTVNISDTESWLALHGVDQPGITAVKSTWGSEVAI
jgi:hypothetical protein